ncbi:tRNA (adenosine(37)-N6)-threonylcarbamoyltransferase complex dimerization subunit type 1 TsaB [Antarcticibacterium flavum]|uniref:tRNA (Adenosine(37)-N6)-threonylcarbamoyltransferase complex dimerization subunit type 1 TsaB n=1 Tax=Antarcticibacterium flavum TaxID=2058175 RepID=A0A5B7X415_9FLAO|nr:MULTISPECIES: tRNA (adenosine(37)-N6)-threonylcarbamoyltransferase complex dimerization subunit type 1 TsaB [Antarcticibacterium]MCM4158376.1 tRNA (adenosine(37)-N6)-threonylcarbamoyltransferase complex dimerization subunit type 1 TsaB [Antarcticibacterium sp. W02-3]QCY70137.1 tRNA (adenosine(37)-N6)-threonylcarbamoyltransferase complex dimerization subunit type 1 TsaB [Antarcticibacterium flavum]
MHTILCLETASTNCSVAIGREGEILGLKEDYSKNFSHAERLHIFIEEILKENNLTFKDLDAIAISEGPGSYTGLRIGVSAAKGLCYSLELPLIAVPTLTSLASQVKVDDETNNEFVIPMMDARRMEVYTAVYDAGGNQIEPVSAKILDENSYTSYLEKGKVHFIGSGVEKFEKICSHPNANFIREKLPSAKEMVKIAAMRYKNSDLEDVAYFVPYYLKDFIAG